MHHPQLYKKNVSADFSLPSCRRFHNTIHIDLCARFPQDVFHVLEQWKIRNSIHVPFISPLYPHCCWLNHMKFPFLLLKSPLNHHFGWLNTINPPLLLVKLLQSLVCFGVENHPTPGCRCRPTQPKVMRSEEEMWQLEERSSWDGLIIQPLHKRAIKIGDTSYNTSTYIYIYVYTDINGPPSFFFV